VLVDVVGAVRDRHLEHRPEHAVLAWQRPHRGDQLVAHPGSEELAEAALAVRQPECRVAGAGELARALHEPLQHLFDRQLGGHRQHGVADGPERRVQLLLGHARTIDRNATVTWACEIVTQVTHL
jgi:hypothetical protein